MNLHFALPKIIGARVEMVPRHIGDFFEVLSAYFHLGSVMRASTGLCGHLRTVNQVRLPIIAAAMNAHGTNTVPERAFTAEMSMGSIARVLFTSPTKGPIDACQIVASKW